MAESIIDVIARLSLDVTSKGLDAQIQALQKQASLIDAQQKKLDNLKIAYDNAANPQAQQALQAQITKTSAVIDANTASLQKNFAANKQIQKAIEDEVGIINQLSRTLAGLQEGQKKATSPADIKAFSENIRVVQSEMKALLTPIEPIRQTGAIEALQLKITQLGNAIKQAPAKDVAALNQELNRTQAQLTKISNLGKETEKQTKGGGVISSIFGGQSLGRQLLQGSLLGLGIGSGFGIITRAVSGLIEELQKTDAFQTAGKYLLKFDDSLHGTSKYLDELDASFKKTRGELKALVDEFNSSTINIPNRLNGVGDLQNQLELAKATGVVNRDKAQFDENVFNVEQAEAVKQKQDLIEQNNLIKTLLITTGHLSELDKSQLLEAEQKNSKIRQELVLRKQAVDLLPASEESTQKSLALRESIRLVDEQLKKNILSFQLNNDQIEKYGDLQTKVTRKIAELKKEQPLVADEEIERQAFRDLTKELGANQQEIAKLQTKYDADKIKRASDIQAAIDNLNLQLGRKALSDQDANFQAQIASQENFGKKTVYTIEERINNQRNAELRSIDQQQSDEDLKQRLTSDVIAKYNTLRSLTNKKYNDQILKEDKQHSLDVLLEDAELQQNLLSKQIEHLKALEAYQLRYDQVDVDSRLKQEDEIERLNQAKNDEEYRRAVLHDTELLKQLETQGKRETELYAKTKTDLENLQKAHNLKSDDIEKAAQAARVAAIEKAFKDNQKLISEDTQEQVNKNDANATPFTDPQADTRARLLEAQKNIGLARENARLINNSPDSTQQDKESAESELNKARADLKKVQKEIRDAILDSVNSLTESINNSIQLIGNTINQMYDRQEKLLDTQLQAQQIRVNNATELAKRGDTEQLRSEQDKLNGIAKARENLTRRQVQLNNILAVSNAAVAASEAIVAVIKAAGNTTEGGVVSFIAALVAGAAAVAALVISIKSAAQANQFDEGGYTGDGGKKDVAGTVHKGEFVMNKATTAKHRGLFEAIHSNQPIPIHELAHLRMAPLQTLNPQPFASKAEINSLSKKLDGVIDAINANTVNVKQNVDKNGVMQMVETQKKIERRRFMS